MLAIRDRVTSVSDNPYMGLTYHHLHEADTRERMAEMWRVEWEDLLSESGPRACYGKQLSDKGWDAYGRLMREALIAETDEWLIERMSDETNWVDHLQRRGKSGAVTQVEYNKRDAVTKLCLGEFNIGYIRGLALALQARGSSTCLIYRAGAAEQERAECSRWEGTEVPLQQVIDGHRVRYYPAPGDRHAWSLPTGPNCHHSIRAAA